MDDKILTSKKRELSHRHMEKEQGELLEVSKVLGEQFVTQTLTPDTFEKVKRPTRCYNCHGFAFADRHGWVTNPEVTLADDFVGATGPKQEGDVVLYLKDALLTHSAVAVKVTDGEIVLVKSKWGESAEVIHLINEVPQVYGIPAVFMRRVGKVTVPDTKCPGTDTADVASAANAASEVKEENKEGAPANMILAETPPAASAPSPLEAAADELGAQLMLASSPEVRDRIIREQVGARAGSTQPSGDLSLLTNASTTGTPPAVTGAADQSAIEEQLSQLLDPRLNGQLMLASTSGVAKRIISSLQPVRLLTEMAKLPDPASGQAAVGSAALRFFQNHEEKGDNNLINILLLLMKNFPVKDAVAPIAQYLLNRKPVGLTRTLAVEAFATAAVI